MRLIPRPGGNFTQPREDMLTRETSYAVFVRWVEQPEHYATAIEADVALRAACASSDPDVDERRHEQGGEQ